MKNLISTFKILVVLLILGSCSVNGEVNPQGEENPSEYVNSVLKSISVEHYINGVYDGTVRYAFNQNKIEEIKYGRGSYDEFTYSGDKLVEIKKFTSEGVLDETVTYEYDALDRLIRKINEPHQNLEERSIMEKTFDYSDGKIISTLNAYDADHVLTDSNAYTLTLGANGLIVKEESNKFMGMFYSQLNFNSNNPAEFIESGYAEGEDRTTAYTYSDQVAANACHLTKFMFGKEWKNNTILNRQFNLDSDISSLISDNYLTGYETLKDDTQEVTDRVTVEYAFDSENRLMSQTKYRVVNGYEYESEFSYFYND